MLAVRCTLSPRTVPSRRAASSRSWIMSRPWWAETRLSERDSVYLTGLPSRLAARNAISSSGVTCSLPPNPPPTSGAITRTLCSGVPVTTDTSNRRVCGICVADPRVYWSPLGSATTMRGSMNAGISRCCRYSRLISTSAPDSASSRDRAATTATVSPTWRTSSTAIGGWSGCTMSSVTSQAHGRVPCTSATSRPLNAATTPGSRSAGAVSTRVIRAWARGLRRIARGSIPGRVTFSVHRVRPVISRASSLRWRGAPTSLTVVVMSPSSRHRLGDGFRRHRFAGQARVGGAGLARLRGGRRRPRRLAGLAQRRRGVAHRPHDVLVPGAAAQFALQPFAYLLVAGVGVLAEQVHRRHDHAGGAEPALQRVPLVEGPLDRVQHVVRTGQALDRGDLAAVGLDREHRAALHADRPAVRVGHQDGAGAAVAGVAADHGADLAAPLAQVVDEQGTGFDVVVVADAVDGDADPGHRASRLPRGSGAQTGRADGRTDAPAPSPSCASSPAG